jgi:hypothetical protein
MKTLTTQTTAARKIAASSLRSTTIMSLAPHAPTRDRRRAVFLALVAPLAGSDATAASTGRKLTVALELD